MIIFELSKSYFCFMLTNACKYAIRAVIYLVMYADSENKIGAKIIAKDLQVPQPFLAKLLKDLAGKGIISSSKGPGGGFYLTKENQDNTLWDVIISISDGSRFDECFLGLVKCNNDNPCPVHYAVVPFKKKLLADFKQKTIRAIVEEVKTNGTAITLGKLTV
ncbi:Rrf2 family transcriptional regulator [Allomuricauda sp. NBRC 101325]|uniref:RrF2 family transcriptional regulator n=1 Tax=Allomuricauda sp. NBRC 101325 TaxID=1113758 RepID=UPI0025547943|nr:Rrf2 family transcriptional regulator [Muricauda sp. NBRC 101325]